MAKTFLLLIPDALQRDLATLALQRAGFAALVCPAAEQLPAMLAEHRPDGLLVDLFLPGVNGLHLLEQLYTEDRFGGARLFIVSALAFPEVVLRARKLGALDFFVKPLQADLLVERMQRALPRD
ncbi:MAG: response regulator [Chloroflexota bacterium]|jgi:DNA-binding response OmpR family regulator